MSLTADEVRWTYRILLDREPESEDVVTGQAMAYASLADLRKVMVNTPDFKAVVREPRAHGIMPFLLPETAAGRIEIEIPTLERPVSQLCTHSQLREAHFRDFCIAVGFDPDCMHRKYWEWAYIFRVLETEGLTTPGKRGLVFAAGQEPLPALLATRGVDILATDGPSDVAKVWGNSKEFAKELESLWKPEVLSWDAFQRRVSFEVADMRNIPTAYRDFDFVWSACSLEHLGGLRAGMEFVKNAMACLKPGGLAVHTTEFNLSSNDDTVDDLPTCIYRRRDCELLASELRAEGHDLVPFNFFPGHEPLDSHIDYPPYAPPHLRLALMNHVVTSVGIIIRKR